MNHNVYLGSKDLTVWS